MRRTRGTRGQGREDTQGPYKDDLGPPQSLVKSRGALCNGDRALTLWFWTRPQGRAENREGRGGSRGGGTPNGEQGSPGRKTGQSAVTASCACMPLPGKFVLLFFMDSARLCTLGEGGGPQK